MPAHAKITHIQQLNMLILVLKILATVADERIG
jgi:hypothetical protein